MNPRVAPLAAVLRINTRLLCNCVDGLTDEQAASRPAPPANSVAFLVAHLTDARHSILRLLGGSAPNPLTPYLAEARGIDDVRELPPLAELLAAWSVASTALEERLETVDAATLDAPSPQRFPGDDRSVLGGVAFLVQHDSYHLGQLGMLRRLHGLPAMRYR